MKPNPYPGFFIDIEGLDGSGSTTQVNLLAARLTDEGYKAYKTKEPTDNVIGGFIRGALTRVIELPATSLQLLFAADRSHHLAREIEPILKNKTIIITDRYAWSTIAFGSLEADKEWLLELNSQFIIPDVSILVKVRPEECLKRIRGERFSYELYEELTKLRRVWQGFEWLAKKFPKQVVIVDGEQKPQEVLDEILNHIKKHPKFKKLLI